MPGQLITSQDPIRYIHRSYTDPNAIPLLDTTEFVDIYKGELVVNTSSNPAVYLRSGYGSDELDNDLLVRIGNVVVSDTDPFTNSRLNKEGLFWFNPNSKALYLHTGTTYTRVDSPQALEGLAGSLAVATNSDMIVATSDTLAVTPKKLDYWASYNGYVKQKVNADYVFVDSYLGDDSIENDGSDSSQPFLTIERAAIEVARRKLKTIYVLAGDYLLDTRKGFSSLSNIQTSNSGPINPLNLEVTVTNYSEETLTLTTSNNVTLNKNQQVFFSLDNTYTGYGIVETLTTEQNTVTLRTVKGSIPVGASLVIAQTYSFNSTLGGVLLANGCSLIGLGKVTFKPSYIAALGSVELSLVKLTSGGSISNITFQDSDQARSHHLTSCVGYVQKEDLTNSDYGIYAKVNKLFGLNQLAEDSELTAGYSLTLLVDKLNIQSDYGLCGVNLTDFSIDGSKSVYVSNVTMFSQQLDTNAYASEGVYLESWQHYLVKADGENTVVCTGIAKGVPVTAITSNAAVVTVDNLVTLS